MESATWHIVCPGPSLDWGLFPWHDGNPIICVNRALHEAKRCDYWAAIDKPNQNHHDCREDFERLGPVVLCTKKVTPMWKEWGAEKIEKIEGVGGWVMEARGGGPKYTIFFATDYACRHGAKFIHYHGVDMKGDGYRGTNGKDPRKKYKNWDSDRWKAKELQPMRRMYQASHARGVHLLGLPKSVTGV